mmetsp:Transcript_15452/g.31041  ORF Transcript_15452/g.31041 Transcript_15452/m.31041 type:complete len:448 (-) Transcript_15452:803-2146(-)|eukprot:CAMPEP_0174695038 /NCGR_PEP_ID=MMETSP1094-20130205/1496_1 /TAXON_ID=156173 /ORGANISM="Chrysochromulina brevifilum, Strain UTEX LB 985" /LENGTH=447 /DNA_ID=CAMNT_0015891433 /DNA_START=455 /DNA_END=1798 /DNA_ORIENTATION=+
MTYSALTPAVLLPLSCANNTSLVTSSSAPSQMKRIVAWASIQYTAHVDGATIHVTGPDERQVEFGDGTTSFATLSGGRGYLNSTVTVYGPDFISTTGTSVNDMIALIRDQQVAIVSQQVEIEALKQFVGMKQTASPPPASPGFPHLPPSPPPASHIYVIGGYGGTGVCCGHPWASRYRTVERFSAGSSLGSGTWQYVASMSILRHSAATAVLEGYIYAIGGAAGNGGGFVEPNGACERYSPASNQWSSIASMRTARQETAAAAVNGYVYVFGGRNPNNLNIVEKYNPNTNQWTTAASMGTARKSFDAVVFAGFIYVFGGTGDGGGLSSVERYSPGADTWEYTASMGLARSTARAAHLNEHIYVMGGSDTSVERFDPVRDTWRFVAPLLDTRAMNNGLAVFQGYLYALGGDWSKGVVEVYDHTDGFNGSWTSAAPTLSGRSIAGVAVL